MIKRRGAFQFGVEISTNDNQVIWMILDDRINHGYSVHRFSQAFCATRGVEKRHVYVDQERRRLLAFQLYTNHTFVNEISEWDYEVVEIR